MNPAWGPLRHRGVSVSEKSALQKSTLTIAISSWQHHLCLLARSRSVWRGLSTALMLREDLILNPQFQHGTDSTSRNNLHRNGKCHWAKASTRAGEQGAAEVNDGLLVRVGFGPTISSLPALNSWYRRHRLALHGSFASFVNLNSKPFALPQLQLTFNDA